MIELKILLLLLVINGTPPVIARLLPKMVRWRLDSKIIFIDGHPLLGSHKTIGGFISGIVAGGIYALVAGFPAGIGLGAGILAMLGDSISSFIKRRLNLSEGKDVFPLDQLFEGLLPILLLNKFHYLSWNSSLIILILFIATAWGISKISGKIFRHPAPTGSDDDNRQVEKNKDSKPDNFTSYLRNKKNNTNNIVRVKGSFKEWRACHIALSPMARLLNFESVIYYRWFMEGIFKCTGIYERGKNNALKVTLNSVRLSFSSLPASFDNYRILFLTDLHLDGLDGLVERVKDIVSEIDADLCIMGGDYRMEMYGPFDRANKRLAFLIDGIKARDGIFGVLGNHDCLKIAPELEDAGICMLINDSIIIDRGQDVISLVGVDDPHYYKCHNLKQAFANVPKNTFTLLVSHSPEIINYTDGIKIDLCLCGHTHGGQICLPYIGPVFTHSRTRRRFTSGLWQHGNITGYTSNGVGVSGVPVRFNCPPEITLITLNRSAYKTAENTAAGHKQKKDNGGTTHHA